MNTAACPTADPTPDPQFAGTIICVYGAPRPTSQTQQRKQDINENSPSFGKWLKADGSYSSTEGGGDYFLTGAYDAELCPVAPPVAGYAISTPQGNPLGACGAAAVNTAYSEDSPLVDGSGLFNDSALTIPVSNGYYYVEDMGSVVRIIGGEVILIIPC